METKVSSLMFFTHRVKGKRKKKISKDALIALVLIGPSIIWWGITSALPLTVGFLLGFFEWIGLNSKPKFVWFNNYIRFFTDEYYYMSFLRSVWIGLLCMAITVVLGLLVALLLNMKIKLRGLYRTIWYIPAVTATVATTQIFNMFIDPNTGVVNNILKDLGMSPVAWTMSTFWGIVWIVIYSAWKGIGGSALIWLAGLQSIDTNLYEAAKVDGANKMQIFNNVTIPGLRPIASYILITGIIGAVQIYEQVMFITGGGPFGTTEVLVYRIMRDAFWDFNFGMAGSSSMVLACFVFIFSVKIFKNQTRESEG